MQSVAPTKSSLPVDPPFSHWHCSCSHPFSLEFLQFVIGPPPHPFEPLHPYIQHPIFQGEVGCQLSSTLLRNVLYQIIYPIPHLLIASHFCRHLDIDPLDVIHGLFQCSPIIDQFQGVGILGGCSIPDRGTYPFLNRWSVALPLWYSYHCTFFCYDLGRGTCCCAVPSSPSLIFFLNKEICTRMTLVAWL